jgi:amidase
VIGGPPPFVFLFWAGPRAACQARNLEGVYPISLAGRLASIRDRANELPDTVKIGMLLGSYTDKYYQGYFYFKAQNLRRRPRAAYDKAFAANDLLLMPTTRMMASKIPPPDAPLAALMQHSWEQITNTCPFNITHHPALSIPCGLGEGERPIGLMLIARHWQEALLYRVADAFQRATNWQTMGPPAGRGKRTHRPRDGRGEHASLIFELTISRLRSAQAWG